MPGTERGRTHSGESNSNHSEGEVSLFNPSKCVYFNHLSESDSFHTDESKPTHKITCTEYNYTGIKVDEFIIEDTDSVCEI